MNVMFNRREADREATPMSGANIDPSDTMNAFRYTAELSLEDLYRETYNLSEMVYMVLRLGTLENDSLDEERCEAAMQAAWQLTRHAARLMNEFEGDDRPVLQRGRPRSQAQAEMAEAEA